MNNGLGTLAIILHAHLPYVRHPERENVLEETWLYEAITETYIPFLVACEQLMQENVDFRFTVSLSPPLLHLLQDELVRTRYHEHLLRMLELAEKEVARTSSYPPAQAVARHYQTRLTEVYEYWLRWNQDITKAFQALEAAGKVELIASAATHGFLPLLAPNRIAVECQIGIGVEAFQRCFGHPPRGFWLPECGYYPGLDEILAAWGVQYTILDSHGLLNASPKPRHAVYAPIQTRNQVYFFGRDWESSRQVWSATEGYPGDPVYRDFYRDIGFDLDWDYISPYLPAGIRGFTGFKYHAITGKTDHKELYQWEWAKERAAVHAGNFMFNREHQFKWLDSQMDKQPIVVAPYDAELFGHWWYEGPWFLYYLAKKVFYDQRVFRLGTPSEYLSHQQTWQRAEPAFSSWGNGGYAGVWLNQTNDWIYRHLHRVADEMVLLASIFPSASGVEARALNQAARELLLAQSSDWPFIMTTGTVRDYAVKRIKDHLGRFNEIAKQLKNRRIDTAWLAEIERRDNIFPWIDYRRFHPDHGQTASPPYESSVQKAGIA